MKEEGRGGESELGSVLDPDADPQHCFKGTFSLHFPALMTERCQGQSINHK